MEKPNTLSATEVLETYQEVWALTQRMLEQARAAEWEALVATGGVRNQLVEKLRVGDKVEAASQAFIDSKGATIRNILDADMEIRKLSEDWMGELRGILGNLDVKKKIHKAYNIESF